MKTIIVDYLGHYYSAIAKSAVPETVLGKFVQIIHEETEYLVFAPKEYLSYHADIVGMFCRERGIDGTVNPQQKSFEIIDPSWNVEGGGKFEHDRKRKLLHLYDNSMAYGRFDTRGLKERVGGTAEFSGCQVIID